MTRPSRRRRWLLGTGVLLLVLLSVFAPWIEREVLPGLTGAGAERDGPAWRRLADEALHRGNTDAVTEARRFAWQEAGSAYRNAFRLLDPVPAKRAERGYLAFRVGLAFSRSARAHPVSAHAENMALDALLWLGQALGLAPGLHAVWYERARLRDSEIASVRDPERAREAYARFLEASAELEFAPEAETRLRETARERLEALGGPPSR